MPRTVKHQSKGKIAPRAERRSFTLRTNDAGMHETLSVPKASKEIVTALKVLSEWGRREADNIIGEAVFKRMYRETRRFMRECAQYREAMEKRRAEHIGADQDEEG